MLCPQCGAIKVVSETACIIGGDDQVCNAIGYAVSKDGTTWKKDNAYTVVNGRRGELDAYGSCAASVVPREDGLWMYYTMSDNGRNYRVGLIKCKGKRAE